MTMSIFDRIYYWNLRRQKERDDDYSRYVTAYSDGEKKGFEKAINANKLEMARRMKEDGLPTDFIRKYIDLDKETVEEL